MILNNQSYRILKQRMVITQGKKSSMKSLAMDIHEPAIDFVKLAQSMGVEVTLIGDFEALERELTDALRADAPRLLDVRLSNVID